jgi:acetyl-CoA carboxylase biotin carboxyl carrier protein
VTPLTEDDVREILQLIDESGRRAPVETGVHAARAPRTDGGARGDAGGGRLHTIAAPISDVLPAPAPGAAPYVDVGSRVAIDTVVCLIEVMKMMNPVPAGISGMIAEICADNAELVEYGSPLFLVRSEGA